MIRQRLSAETVLQVFLFVVNLPRERGLVLGKIARIDATTLAANATMMTILRTAGGDGWKDWLRKLPAAEGTDNPTDDDLPRLDRQLPRPCKLSSIQSRPLFDGLLTLSSPTAALSRPPSSAQALRG